MGIDDNLSNEVMKEIIKRNLTVSTAESCTGGKVAATLIDYAGASEAFLEGAVTYTNESKMKRLGVKQKTLDKYGAVSEETAYEMAKGIAQRCETDIGLSTTGVAGPDGGTAEKPVGLVYVGIYIKGMITVKKLQLDGNREEVRNNTVKEILTLLKMKLKEI